MTAHAHSGEVGNSRGMEAPARGMLRRPVGLLPSVTALLLALCFFTSWWLTVQYVSSPSQPGFVARGGYLLVPVGPGLACVPTYAQNPERAKGWCSCMPRSSFELCAQARARPAGAARPVGDGREASQRKLGDVQS